MWEVLQMNDKESSMPGAVVILKTKSDLSLAKPMEAITSKNIDEYRPLKKTKLKAIQELQKLGFAVKEAKQDLGSFISPTITGKPELFERVFNVKLKPEKLAPSLSSSGGVAWRSDRELEIPESLKDTVECVTLEGPKQLFKKK